MTVSIFFKFLQISHVPSMKIALAMDFVTMKENVTVGKIGPINRIAQVNKSQIIEW